MITAYYIKRNHYDFTDKNGKRVVGNNITVFDGDEVSNVTLDNEQYKAFENAVFGDTVTLEIRKKGKFAYYVLAN